MDQETVAPDHLVISDLNPVSAHPEPGEPAEQIGQLLGLYEGYKRDNPGVVYVGIDEVIANLELLHRTVRGPR
jgi:hypothetical protein